jgi:GntR family transcriptional repressor for pyruvate dehydrogenase complex
MIMSGELAEGDNLPPEPDLVLHFGVSRPTLREALRILESESLIRTRRGSRSGAEVCAPRIETSARCMGFVLQHEGVTVDDVILEPPLAKLTATRRDDATINELRRALEAEEAALGDRADYAAASIHFHEVVVNLAGVKTLSLTVRQYNWVLGRLMEDVRAHSAEVRTGDPKSHSAHSRYVDLVISGEPNRTRPRRFGDHTWNSSVVDCSGGAAGPRWLTSSADPPLAYSVPGRERVNRVSLVCYSI